MKEGLSHLRFRQRIGRLVIIFGELPYGAEVALAGTVGESSELKVLKKLPAKRRHDMLLSESVVVFRRSIGASTPLTLSKILGLPVFARISAHYAARKPPASAAQRLP